MEVVVVGRDNATVVEELRRRGMKVIVVPGDEVVVYVNFPHTGFQELVGEDAERYIQSILAESAYFIEYY